MFSDSDLLPISGLQHLLYCERQCALIHLDRVWEENLFTAEGRLLHEKTHEEQNESRGNIKICRSLHLKSLNLGLFGVSDVVEFYYENISRAVNKIIPIEYKRGKAKSNRCDEIQLCAQMLCLEEMLDISIGFGYLYYGSTKRRVKITFDEELRNLTKATAEKYHALIQARRLPQPSFEKKKCNNCSLFNICMPTVRSNIENYVSQIFETEEPE